MMIWGSILHFCKLDLQGQGFLQRAPGSWKITARIPCAAPPGHEKNP